MTKELTLQQVFGNGAAVYNDEGNPLLFFKIMLAII
jgi:hypothetical protein